MARPKKQPAEVPTSTQVEVAGVLFDVREGVLPHVPAIRPEYIWPSHAYDVAKDLQENNCVMLTGHAGVGKSTLTEQIAARINQPVRRVPINGSMTVSDLLGFWTVINGSTVWVNGILTQAVVEGWWIILDEFDFALPAILACLQTITEPLNPRDPIRILELKEKGGECIRAHANFRIIATGNTIGCMEEFRHLYGTEKLSASMTDRFNVYYVPYLSPEEEARVFMAVHPRFNAFPDLASKMVEVTFLLRSAFEKQEISLPFSTRRLHQWGKQLLRDAEYNRARGDIDNSNALTIVLKAATNTIMSRYIPEEQNVITEIITRVMGEDA